MRTQRRQYDNVFSIYCSLCNEQKQRVLNSMEEVLKSYENNPAFLLTLLRSLKLFKDSAYAQQKLVCLLDELTEHMPENFVEVNEDIESIRSRIHLSTFKFIDAIVKTEIFSEENVSQIVHHSNSMLYSHMISHTSSYSQVGLHPIEAVQIMSQTSPIIEKLCDSYKGQHCSCGPMLAYDINRVFDSAFGWGMVDYEDEEDEYEDVDEDDVEIRKV
jgi:hypothetical protein